MSNNHQFILFTGSSGFIGSNLVLRLLESDEPFSIVGLDILNDYYDPSLKEYGQVLSPPSMSAFYIPVMFDTKVDNGEQLLVQTVSAD